MKELAAQKTQKMKQNETKAKQNLSCRTSNPSLERKDNGQSAKSPNTPNFPCWPIRGRGQGSAAGPQCGSANPRNLLSYGGSKLEEDRECSAGVDWVKVSLFSERLEGLLFFSAVNDPGKLSLRVSKGEVVYWRAGGTCGYLMQYMTLGDWIWG